MAEAIPDQMAADAEDKIPESAETPAESVSGSASVESYSHVIESFMSLGLTVLNPCKCFEMCCSKYALRVGTFFVAFLYLVDGVVNALPVLIKIELSDDQRYNDDGRTTFYADLEAMSQILHGHLGIKGMLLSLSAVSVVCGLLLVAADILMRKKICFAYTILAGFAMVAALAQMIFLTIAVNRDPHTVKRSRLGILGVWWVLAQIRIIALLYYFLCGFALYVQIKGRQTAGRIQPEMIEWENETKTPKNSRKPKKITKPKNSI